MKSITMDIALLDVGADGAIRIAELTGESEVVMSKIPEQKIVTRVTVTENTIRFFDNDNICRDIWFSSATPITVLTRVP